MSRLPALLATARIANVPSVAGNVWLGVMLGWFHWGEPWGRFDHWPRPWLAAATLAASGALLYLAGAFLNDWHDRDWDARHRPERALPARRFTPPAYLALAATFAAAGIALAFLTGSWPGRCALAITALVIIYTIYHKHRIWAVIVVAACRVLLVVAGFLLAGLPAAAADLPTHALTAAFVALHLLGVFAWIAGISLLARHESAPVPARGPQFAARALLFVPLVAMAGWWIPRYPLSGVLAVLPLAAWLALALGALRTPPRRLVAALLAGVPLVDLVAAIPLTLALVPPDQSLLDNPLLAAGILVPAGAWILGLLLQQLAPAT